jgi:hexosaminidase
MSTDLLLLPEPTRLELLGGQVDVPPSREVRVRERRLPGAPDERSIPGQAYDLRIIDDAPPPGAPPDAPTWAFQLTTASPAGRRLAIATIQQLLRRFPRALPRLAIHDEPSFATRGVMLDISRTRVPTMPQLFEIVDRLAALKFNHLQLYTEHTFAYVGHEDAWAGASPMTPDEVRALDDHCAAQGIELAANQNCFGHLAHWLRLPRYAHLAETHADWMFDVWPRSGPFSLCPTDPASLAFVDDLLEQLLPCFRSAIVNIGADETYDVGWGRSKDAVQRLGKASVYAKFVSEICQRVSARNKRPAFWADIALSHPEALDLLPKDLIALAWDYEPTARFEQWCKLLRSVGREAWVCPGTSCWRSTTGRSRERRGNLRAAATAGAAHGATGFLVCAWGDVGHTQQWPITLHALAHAAQAAWNADASDRFDPRAASLHAFDDDSLTLGPWLEALGDADEPLRRLCGRLSRPAQQGEFTLLNQTALFADLHNCAITDRAEVGSLELWRDAFGRVEDAWVAMPRGLDPLVTQELEHTVDVARLALRRAIARRSGTPGTIATIARDDLLQRAQGVLEGHRRLWPARSRPGGLDASSAHFQKIIDELRAVNA